MVGWFNPLKASKSHIKLGVGTHPTPKWRRFLVGGTADDAPGGNGQAKPSGQRGGDFFSGWLTF